MSNLSTDRQLQNKSFSDLRLDYTKFFIFLALESHHEIDSFPNGTLCVLSYSNFREIYFLLFCIILRQIHKQNYVIIIIFTFSKD